MKQRETAALQSVGTIKNQSVMQKDFSHDTKQMTFNVHIETSDLDPDTFDYFAYVNGKCVCCDMGFATIKDAEQSAREQCNEIAELYPKICRGEGIPTEVLKSTFYDFAQSAPTWASEVLNLVAESKLRKWLIEKLQGMIAVSDMIDIFGKYVKQ